MKKFLEKLGVETLWGGIFGAIAILAILVELFLNGISAESVIGAVKDIAGIIVSVMVFAIAIKQMIKQIQDSKTFEERLEKALITWQKDHSAMVVRKEKYDYEHENTSATCFSFGLKTNLKDFYENRETQKTGWFVRMPLLTKENYNNGNVVLKFRLNKGTFFEGINMTEKELANSFKELNNLFTKFINACFENFAEAKTGDSVQDVIVVVKKPINTTEDIDNLVSVVDSMYNAYLVAANLNIK